VTHFSDHGFALLQIAHDGYVIDFGDIKKITRKLCKELNEHFLCPQRSDVIDVQVADGQVTLQCQDGAKFSFPEVKELSKIPLLRCCCVRLGLVIDVLRSTTIRLLPRLHVPPSHRAQRSLFASRWLCYTNV
jgi:6-pyruvoyl-tetrahydropterin synthase